jgi:hypothetical protein
MIETGVMSIGDATAILAFLGTLLACTWHLSAKMQQLISDGRVARSILDTHILDYRLKIVEFEKRLSALEQGHVARGHELA